MPAYMTHAIMSEDVFKEAIRTVIFKTPIHFESLKTYSIGHDLSGLSRISSYKSHNQDTRLFFMEMIKYIKEHGLQNDSVVMALLYGHMCHYFLDINTHPIIYYNELGLKNVTKISNHMLVEGFISYYFLECKTEEIGARFFNQGSINKECEDLLKSLYLKVYQDPTFMRSLKLVLKAFTVLENVSKDYDMSRVSGFSKFLKENEISSPYLLLNPNHDVWTQPITGEKHTESFIDLYFKSIDMTLDAIKKVNEYLYENMPLSSLERVFTNISLDTGVNCSYGHEMTYVRRK